MTSPSGSLVLPSTLLTTPSYHYLKPANVHGQFSLTPSTPTCELGKENSSHISYCTIYWMGVISSIINILLREPVPRKEETQSFSSAQISLHGHTIARLWGCHPNARQVWPFLLAVMPPRPKTLRENQYTE